MNDSLRKIARFDLMEQIANANDGYETKASDPECDALARLGYVQCRRSIWNGINDREWWWLTDAGKAWLKSAGETRNPSTPFDKGSGAQG